MISDARIAFAWIILGFITIVATSDIEHETQVRTWLMLAATAVCYVAWRYRSK